MSLSYGSLCSGIGSEILAWDLLGWKCKWVAEIDPISSYFLQSRYGVPNLGDIKRIVSRQYTHQQLPEQVDLIVGGTPCQSFSINGRRDGMDDKRGVLSLSFMQIVDTLKPRWVVWENVENCIRVDKGRAFGAIISALEEFGYGWSYRVLNLQHFGIPQHRRRLFLVGHLGSCQPAIASLFDKWTKRQNGKETGESKQAGLGRTDDMVGQQIEDNEDNIFGWTGDTTPKRMLNLIPTVRSSQGGEGVGVIERDGRMRQLTVKEMERLQGFPDNYTRINYRGKPVKEKWRKEAVGNSFPPPILYWLGQRIDFINSLLRSQ